MAFREPTIAEEMAMRHQAELQAELQELQKLNDLLFHACKAAYDRIDESGFNFIFDTTKKQLGDAILACGDRS